MPFKTPDLDAIPRYPVIAGEEMLEKGSGNVEAHVYPANGQVTSELALAGARDVDLAVQAARAASPAWRAMPGNQRRDLMFLSRG